MKTKKTLIAVITATLLVSAMLIIGCMDQLDGIIVKDKDNNAAIVEDADYQIPVNIPAGKGAVRFKIADSNVRTILPDFDEFKVDGNKAKGMFFDIKFTVTTVGPGSDGNVGDIIYFPGNDKYETAGGLGVPVKKATYTELTALITLPENEYDYLITAYNNIDGDLPIAGFTGTGLDVTSGTVAATSVILNLLTLDDDPTLKGIFAYDITLSAGLYDTKKLEIINYATWKANPTTATGTTISLNEDEDNPANKAGTQDLLIGYYIVKVTVGRTHYLTRQYTEVLHIYPGFTSTYTITLVPPLNQNVFDVVFDMNGQTVADSLTTYATRWVNYGETTGEPVDPTSEDTDFDFAGWYNGAGVSAAVWDFTKMILTTSRIYAHWNQNAGFVLDIITPTLTEMETPTIVIGTSLIRGGLDGSNIISITISGGTWKADSFTWTIVDDIAGISSALASNTSNTLVITNGAPYKPLIATGITSFRVYVTAVEDDTDETPYSAFIDVPVTGTVTQ